MPLYRHECETCGHRFRILELEGSKEPVTCPSCGSHQTRRLLARVSVQFKGSGYYKTDRANKRTKAGTKSVAEKATGDADVSSDSSKSGDTE